MNEHEVKRSIKIVIAAVVLICLLPIIGLDNFLDMPLMILAMFIAGFGAAAAGHLVSLLVNLFTGKDHLHLIHPVCSGLLLLISLLMALHESHGFMGHLGAAVIIVLLSVPFGAVFLFQLTVSIIHAVKGGSAARH